MIGPDVKVYADGTVTGTLNYVTDFADFASDPSLQSGHYFPLMLTQSGTTMTLKKNGAAIADKTDLPFDPEILFRIENKNTTYGVAVDGVDVVTLNFKSATLA